LWFALAYSWVSLAECKNPLHNGLMESSDSHIIGYVCLFLEEASVAAKPEEKENNKSMLERVFSGNLFNFFGNSNTEKNEQPLEETGDEIGGRMSFVSRLYI